jgi:hypothetical protein
MTLETVVSGSAIACSAALILVVLVGATGLVPQLQLDPEAVLAGLVLSGLSGIEALTAWQENR